MLKIFERSILSSFAGLALSAQWAMAQPVGQYSLRALLAGQQNCAGEQTAPCITERQRRRELFYAEMLASQVFERESVKALQQGLEASLEDTNAPRIPVPAFAFLG